MMTGDWALPVTGYTVDDCIAVRDRLRTQLLFVSSGTMAVTHSKHTAPVINISYRQTSIRSLAGCSSFIHVVWAFFKFFCDRKKLQRSSITTHCSVCIT